MPILKSICSYVNKSTPYCKGFARQVGIGALLGGIVGFVMIFLQPFGTYSFQSNKKYLIFCGFGIVYFLLYLLWSRLENIWHVHKSKKWSIKNEISSFLFFVLLSSIPIHFYNQIFLNGLFTLSFSFVDYLNHWGWFVQHSILPISILLMPVFFFLRNRLGTLEPEKNNDLVQLFGTNKQEKITLKKESLLYVKASENYIDIYFDEDNTLGHTTFRNTLAVIHKQAPFLKKAHRSYLVNTATIKTITGNSQNAKIVFYHDGLEIPLSKSYFKKVKFALGL